MARAPPLGAWGGFRPLHLRAGGENEDPQTSTPSSDASRPPQPTCGHCYKRFKTPEQLVAHRAQARHSPHDPRCGACGKHFPNLDTLRQHLDGQLPNQRCKARYDVAGCARCLAVAPEGASSPHPSGGCPFEIRPGPEATGARSAVALDCEMVGTEPDGSGAMCARVCVVDDTGATLLSTHVAPTAPVTDHRTSLTGITPDPSRARPRSTTFARASSPSSTTDGPSSSATISRTTSSASASTIPRAAAATPRDTPRSSDTPETVQASNAAAELLGEVIQAEGAAHDPREDAMAAMRLYLGARELCRVHHPDGVAETCRGGTRPEEGSAIDADAGNRRFRCWCGDARRERRARPTPPRRATVDASAKTVTGPSPAKTALRDATNAAWGGSGKTR